MQDAAVGTVVRAIRRRGGLRQRDVARLARVSQQTVSVIERGQLESIDLATLRRVCAALEMSVAVTPRWRGPELDRLLDAGHAQVVEAVVRAVSSVGWSVDVEWSFNRFGERGAVDVLAWHSARRALLVVEVKTRVVDLQDLLGTLDRKVRLAREILPDERGWRPVTVARVVVLPESTSARRAVARHRVTFAMSLPDRSIDVRRWLRDPAGALRAVWFLPLTSGTGAARRGAGPGRGIRVDSRTAAASASPDTSGSGAVATGSRRGPA